MFDKQKANNVAPPPDISPITNALGASASTSAAHANDQYNWAKDQAAKNQGTTDDVVNNALSTQHELDNSADTDRSQYENTAFPALQQEQKDAATYASAGKKDLDVGAAQANVAQNYEAARNNATQQLESFGIKPTDTRYAALDLGTRIGQAADSAAAGTTAANNVDATARQLNHQVYTDSAPLAAQSTNEHAASDAAGTGAVANADANTSTGASTMGTGAQWQGLDNSALTGQAGAVNANYQSTIDATKTNNAAADQNNKTSSGVGTALGAIAALGTGGGTTVGGSIAKSVLGLAKGGAVDPNATPGGAVPAHASPTGGKGVDDVPANLTAGEYIVPKDVVAWKGQEHFQKLIDSSRKAASEATARPTVGPAVGGPATVQSRPQQGAIPMPQAA